MAAPEERHQIPPNITPTLPAPRPPATDRAPAAGPAWFSYTTTGDQIVWSSPLRDMLGRPPAQNEVSRKILARYVHRDDHAKALGAITQTWTGREPVRTTVRLMRTDGGWFDVDCRLEPVADRDGTVRGIRGIVHDVSARERARREVARLARRVESVQPSIIEHDPATGLLTR